MNRIFNNMRYFLMTAFVAVAFFAMSCESEEGIVDNNPINESEVLLQYLEANGDYINTKAPAIKSAEEVKAMDPAKTYIIDVRQPADFAKGHISGAVNVAIKDILAHVEGLDIAKYDNVIIACYTGQSAAFATSALRLLGFDKVYSMKFGMAAWHQEFSASWNDKASNLRLTQFTKDVAAKAAAGNLPVINTGKKTGAEILRARIQQILTDGYTPLSVTNQQVFDNLANYYIVNYWPAAHYNDPGHIPGAIQYEPKSDLKLAGAIKTLPTNKPVVIYCYTGQTSANVVVFLKALGYDAKTLSFGTAGMINDEMKTKKLTHWDPATQVKNYEYIKP